MHVWNLLDENLYRHHCDGWLLRGVVSDRPATTTLGFSYGTRSISIPLKSDKEILHLGKRSYTFLEIQQFTNITVSALLIDCEGCIQTIFRGNDQPLSQLLSAVRTIILEADMPIGSLECKDNCVDYAVWEKSFQSIGFSIAHKEIDPIFRSIVHYVFKRF